MEDTGSPPSSDGFAAALAAADAGAASSPAQPDSAPPDAAAAVQPTEPAVDAPAPEREGFIPRARFDEVNTRKNELEQKWQQWAWAEQYQPTDLQRAAGFVRGFDVNPVIATSQLVEHLLNDPTHGPVLTSQMARWLSARKSQGAAEQEPQPDLVAENGAPVYSAPQLRKWQDWNAAKLRAELTGEIQELKADREARQQAERATRLDHEIGQQADRIMAELRTYDGFVDHEAEITQIYLAHPQMTPHQAYLKWYHEKRLPTLASQATKHAQSQVLADLKSKASAASINPAQPQATTPKRYSPDADGFAAALRDSMEARS